VRFVHEDGSAVRRSEAVRLEIKARVMVLAD
jgi:hypothetical protein